MTELHATIFARVAEIQQAAQTVPHGPWVVEKLDKGYPQRITNAAAVIVAECYEEPSIPPVTARFIAEWGPTAATRVASDAYQLAQIHRVIVDGSQSRCGICGPIEPAFETCYTVRIVADLVGIKS